MTNVFGIEITEELIDKSPGGISASFIKINDRWAIKLFIDEDLRDLCLKRQGKFADAGFGPDVGTTVDFVLDEVNYYGYLTEILETCVPPEADTNDSKTVMECEIKVAEFITEYGSVRQPGTKVYNDLKEAFKATGIFLTDMHSYNLAWKNDKIVPIDFGCDGNGYTMEGNDYEDVSTHSA